MQSAGPGRDTDPFKSMWDASGFDEERQMFEASQLRLIHKEAEQRHRDQGARWGMAIAGLLSMSFGPIGILTGGLLGFIVGCVVGTFFDERRRRSKAQDMRQNNVRLQSLIRWASDGSHKDEDLLYLIEMVVLEFRPMADLAVRSDSARKLLRMLDRWISQVRVTGQLLVYMDERLQNLKSMNRSDKMRSLLVLETVRTMYNSAARYRAFNAQERQLQERLDRLLENAGVRSLLSHCHSNQSRSGQRLTEAVAHADAEKSRSSPRLSQRHPSEETALVSTDLDPEEQTAAFSWPVKNGADSDSEEGGWGAEDALARARPYVTSQGSARSPEQEQAAATAVKGFGFRNWDDFMEFDPNVKHRIPITQSEFGLLLEKEQESCRGWDVPIDRKEIRVAKSQSGPGVITLRAWATVPGVDVNVAFTLFHDTQERKKWDKVFAEMAIIGEDSPGGREGSELLYSVIRPPVATPRDFLQFRRVRVEKDGSILIVLRSAEHPDCPPDKRYVRAESYISGYVLRQEFQGTTPVLKIFLMSCTDIKGLIPKWIINHFAPKKPGEWIDALSKAAKEFQRTHGGSTHRLEPMPSFAEDSAIDLEEGREQSRTHAGSCSLAEDARQADRCREPATPAEEGAESEAAR